MSETEIPEGASMLPFLPLSPMERADYIEVKLTEQCSLYMYEDGNCMTFFHGQKLPDELDEYDEIEDPFKKEKWGIKYALDRMVERVQDQGVRARVAQSLEEWYNSEDPDLSPEDEIMEIFANLDPHELGENFWDINSPTASYNESGPNEENEEEDKKEDAEDATELIEAKLGELELKTEVIS